MAGVSCRCVSRCCLLSGPACKEAKKLAASPKTIGDFAERQDLQARVTQMLNMSHDGFRKRT